MNWPRPGPAIKHAVNFRGYGRAIPDGEVVHVIEYVGTTHRPEGIIVAAWRVKYQGKKYLVMEACLHPLPPPKVGSWDDCVWKPKAVDPIRGEAVQICEDGKIRPIRRSE